MVSDRKSLTQSSVFSSNKVKLIRGGSEYFRLLEKLIISSQHSIHLQTYIFENDETGEQVAKALKEAAKRKVQVYVLVDGYASQSLSSAFVQSLRKAGIHFRFFEPLFKSKYFYFGRRLHSKVMVVDSRYVLMGGVNIANRYNDMPGQPAWLDFGLYLEGPIAKDICILCWKTWKGYPKKIKSAPCEVVDPSGYGHAHYSSLVRMRRNDWVRNKLEISHSYLEMFRTATSYITILSSYALPGNIFRRNLEKAVKRGVRVKMVISGRSDVILVKDAERYWYDWLLRNNIEIYEYQKNVLHGKLAICDGEWMTLGSYNVNDLSAYASIELNLDVRDYRVVKNAGELIQQIIEEDCLLITRENAGTGINLFKRLMQWFSYNLIRGTFNLFTFYYRRHQ